MAAGRTASLYAPIVNFAGAALGITLRPWEEALQDYFAMTDPEGNAHEPQNWIRSQLESLHLWLRSSSPTGTAPTTCPSAWMLCGHRPIRHIEVILVDNGSTDGSQALVTSTTRKYGCWPWSATWG